MPEPIKPIVPPVIPVVPPVEPVIPPVPPVEPIVPPVVPVVPPVEPVIPPVEPVVPPVIPPVPNPEDPPKVEGKPVLYTAEQVAAIVQVDRKAVKDEIMAEIKGYFGEGIPSITPPVTPPVKPVVVGMKPKENYFG